MEQWYTKRKDILQMERAAMSKVVGTPVWGKNCGTLPDNRMYWDVFIRVRRESKKYPGTDLYNQIYHFRLVYQPNHPVNEYGTSIHAIPMAPTDYSFMLKKAQAAGKQFIPHTLHESDGVPYFCTADLNSFSSEYGRGKVVTALTSYLCVVRLLHYFEGGLLDDEVWRRFTNHSDL